MAYQVGDQFLFGDEPITYGQDFAWWRMRVPRETLFTLQSFTHDGAYAWLTAPGYGIFGDYGNGAIHVAVTELVKCRSHRPYVARTWEGWAPDQDPDPQRFRVVEL